MDAGSPLTKNPRAATAIETMITEVDVSQGREVGVQKQPGRRNVPANLLEQNRQMSLSLPLTYSHQSLKFRLDNTNCNTPI